MFPSIEDEDHDPNPDPDVIKNKPFYAVDKIGVEISEGNAIEAGPSRSSRSISTRMRDQVHPSIISLPPSNPASSPPSKILPPADPSSSLIQTRTQSVSLSPVRSPIRTRSHTASTRNIRSRPDISRSASVEDEQRLAEEEEVEREREGEGEGGGGEGGEEEEGEGEGEEEEKKEEEEEEEEEEEIDITQNLAE